MRYSIQDSDFNDLTLRERSTILMFRSLFWILRPDERLTVSTTMLADAILSDDQYMIDIDGLLGNIGQSIKDADHDRTRHHF